MSERTANMLMAAAVGVGAYFVLSTPRLRRLATQALRTGLTATLPGYLLHETKQAWHAAPTQAS